MPVAAFTTAFLALSLNGAIFGFFYAWVCSTMWGLDVINPVVAIEAMQAMNASVRNGVFALGFFGTGPALILAGLVAWGGKRRSAAMLFGAAALIYLVGAVFLTTQIHVPMNTDLAALDPATLGAQAEAIWAEYSPRWQFWNAVRAAVCWVALMCTGAGLALLRAKTPSGLA